MVSTLMRSILGLPFSLLIIGVGGVPERIKSVSSMTFLKLTELDLTVVANVSLSSPHFSHVLVPRHCQIEETIITSNKIFPPILRSDSKKEGHNNDHKALRFNNENGYKKLRRKRELQKTRIIGGGTALKNRFPYIASLTFERGK